MPGRTQGENRGHTLLANRWAYLAECQPDAWYRFHRNLVVGEYLVQNVFIFWRPFHNANSFASESPHVLNGRTRWDDESNYVAPQNGNGLTGRVGKHVTAYHREVDISCIERFRTGRYIGCGHDLQAHTRVGVRQGLHEGGEESLAVTAHGSSGHP